MQLKAQRAISREAAETQQANRDIENHWKTCPRCSKNEPCNRRPRPYLAQMYRRDLGW